LILAQDERWRGA